MRIEPIIPVWIMAVLCVGILFLKRRSKVAFIRQIFIVLLIFVINLRIMVPSDSVRTDVHKLDTYVLFVIDDTISMLARDYDGDTERLTAVKKDCERVVDKMDGAKFAVITFNNNANLVSPYTDNSEYVRTLIDSMSPIDSIYAKGSSMNVCLDVMTDTLKRASEKKDGSVLVFFVSDGEITNDDSLESFSEAGKYIDGGAVMGYGTAAGGNMYVRSYYDDQEELLMDTSDYPYKPAVSRIDEGNLNDIADDLGIGYINMNDGDKLDDVIDRAVATAKSDSDIKSGRGYIDIYYIFALALMILVSYDLLDIKRKYSLGKRR